MFWNWIDYLYGFFNKWFNFVYLLFVFLGKIKYDVLNFVLLNKLFFFGLMFKLEYVYLKNCNDIKRILFLLIYYLKMY